MGSSEARQEEGEVIGEGAFAVAPSSELSQSHQRRPFWGSSRGALSFLSDLSFNSIGCLEYTSKHVSNSLGLIVGFFGCLPKTPNLALLCSRVQEASEAILDSATVDYVTTTVDFALAMGGL